LLRGKAECRTAGRLWRSQDTSRRIAHAVRDAPRMANGTSG